MSSEHLDEHEALLAERDAATQRAEKLRSVLAGANETARRRGEQRDEARGRVAVLEAALQKIADGLCECGGAFKLTGARQVRCEGCGAHQGYGYGGAQEIARAVLAGGDAAAEEKS